VPGTGDFDWQAMLDGTDVRFRRYRSILRRIPSDPRCKMCAAPFTGPGAPLMRAMGRSRWAKNPNYCRICETFMHGHQGGAEVELTFLFADIRGSTTIAERMSPAEFRALLNRFYEIAAQVIIGHDGLVDKFVGDEVVAWFAPPFVGAQHAKAAISAARELLAETGTTSGDGPPIPLGAGVHTGVAFVGVVGDSDMTEFTALGDAVNATARLASAARAGEILVSRAAAAAAQLDTTSLEARHLELRGRTEPMDVVVIRSDVVTSTAVPA
jgi:adenylate cyclase